MTYPAELTIQCVAIEPEDPLERLIVAAVGGRVRMAHARDIADDYGNPCMLSLGQVRELAAWIGRILHAPPRIDAHVSTSLGWLTIEFDASSPHVVGDVPWVIDVRPGGGAHSSNVMFADDQAWELLGWLGDYCAARAKATAGTGLT